ncbi:potassium channel family protein [Halopiger goleimassiliensis]|uniref:potassium channel family protein n=1 Tax=Halopiger goleimassiliensis TaxID=1293048 RepID=UPI0006781030|nr:TrkA family potassium uptake protein [Halopiger goleimassiliensis]
MYLVVIGAGKTGRSLVELAVEDGHDVVVVEIDEEKANAISADYDCLVLHADATNDGTLQDAGIDRADAVISTTNVDAVNIMVMLLAQEHDVPNLLSVVHEPAHLPVFEKIGVNVIENPQRLIAEYLYHSVQYPGVSDFVELADGTELVELAVDPGSPVADQSLADAKSSGELPEGCLVVALQRGDELYPPDGTTVLSAGDDVTLLVDDEHIDDAIAAFSSPE